MMRRSQTLHSRKTSLIPTSGSSPNRSLSSISLASPPKSTASSSAASRRSKLSDSTNLLHTKLPEELFPPEEDIDWKAKVTALEAENAKLQEESARVQAENTKVHAENVKSQAENTKLRTEVRSLSMRPTQVAFDDLQKEHAIIESILDGTQRENAHAEEQIRFLRERQKKLEEALARWVGPNWATVVDVPPISTGPASRRQSRLFGEETVMVLPTLAETSFVGAPVLADDVDMDAKPPSASPAVENKTTALNESTNAHATPASISEQLLQLYDTSEDSAEVAVETALADSGATSLRASEISVRQLSTSISQSPGRLEDQPAFQSLVCRVKAIETIIKKHMIHNMPEHAGELSMVRDEWEVERLMKEL